MKIFLQFWNDHFDHNQIIYIPSSTFTIVSMNVYMLCGQKKEVTVLRYILIRVPFHPKLSCKSTLHNLVKKTAFPHFMLD